MKYIPLFILIQLVSLVLTLLGIPVCWVLTSTGTMYIGNDGERVHFPKWAWIWDNDEDGVSPLWYNPEHTRWRSFVWTALRNPCNNLRFVWGVSKPGRPLWLWTNGKYYAKAGWEAGTGWPSLSAGAGTGF